MGFGLDSDIHSPNEHFGIFNYLRNWNYSVVLQIFCWVKQINVLHINLQNRSEMSGFFLGVSSLQNY
jgi:hypothetical protein